MEAYRGVLKFFLLILIIMFVYLYGDKVGLYEPYTGDVRTKVYITENGTLNLEGPRYRVDFGCKFYSYQLKAINFKIETESMINDIMFGVEADVRRKLELGNETQKQELLITPPEILSKLKEKSLARVNKLKKIKTLVIGSIQDCQDPENSFWAAFKSHYNSQRIDERGLTP